MTNPQIMAQAQADLDKIRGQMELFSGRTLAQISGVDESIVSRFKNGSNPNYLTIRALQLAMQHIANEGLHPLAR